MTLQQIADYAMEYLNGKGVAAEYDIFEKSKAMKVTVKGVCVMFLHGDDAFEVERMIRTYLL